MSSTMTQPYDPKAFLSAASVHPSIFTLRPDYRVLLITISGIKPFPSDSTSESLLTSAESSARTALTTTPVNDLPHISAWRAAYKSFGAKPNKTRNSLEALTRRVEKSNLPRVNRLTDIYNAISVKHQIPLGGEDLDLYSGPPRLIVSDGSDDFVTVAEGKPVTEKAEKGEVVWCDEEGVTCRRWNWRQGTRTALSEKTTRALFILDVLRSAVSDEELERAADELVEALGGEGEVSVERRIIGKDLS